MTTKARTLTGSICALVIAASMLGCDFLGLSEPSGPGELHLNVLSPNGVIDGAAVLEISGPTGQGAITSELGDVFYERDGTTTRVVLILNDPGLLSIGMRVEDVAELPTLTVVQVADGNNQLRASVSGYEAEWIRLADSDRDYSRSNQ